MPKISNCAEKPNQQENQQENQHFGIQEIRTGEYIEYRWKKPPSKTEEMKSIIKHYLKNGDNKIAFFFAS